MCGIAGIYNLDNRSVERELLRKMSDAMVHRGPDREGMRIDGNIGISHKRLKIIDLSDEADQPMENEDSTILITYNGEIYNYIELRQQLISSGHQFKSRSDSEVVVHAYEQWGVQCLDTFIGMWAFCLWDRQKNIFFVARDRLGIKPLYYLYNKNIFIFASEIKSILQILNFKRKMNYQAVYEYLYLGYTLDDNTWFAGIKKLLPGYYLILDKGCLTLQKYWDTDTEIDYSLSQEKAKDRIQYLLEDAVRLRLRSDVEIGAHLSGGIDSSSVVGLVSKNSRHNIHTFSGAFDESETYDERIFIHEMLKAYPLINHHEIVIRADNFLKVMQKIIWHLDEPTAGPGVYPQYFVSQLIHNSNIKVVLGGQGGDELFGGYPYYYSGVIQSFIELLMNNNRYFFSYVPSNISLRPLIQYLRRCASQYMQLRKKRLHNLLRKKFLEKIDFAKIQQKSKFYSGSVDIMMRWDLNYYLPALLQVEDRMSMAFSVETRLPLLDHRLVKFVLAAPFYFKVHRSNSKYIFREAVKHLLPPLIYKRQDKMGFPTPFKLWILNDEFRSIITKEISDVITEIFEDKKGADWEKLNIGLWIRTFGIAE
jgi:asparagine synthase (glutamine-hydrolysing)